MYLAPINYLWKFKDERCLYMQESGKAKILELWKQGYGSSRIAEALGLNVNSVKVWLL